MVTYDNIDSNINSHLNKQFKLKNIIKMLLDLMNTYNIAQINHKNTRHTNHKAPSCIDHMYTNAPNKISDVNTYVDSSSDHSIVSAYYNTSAPIYKPKFVRVKNHKLLSKNTLWLYFDNNEHINENFAQTDPNVISNILQIELNTIINTISLAKITQYKNDYTPYLNGKIKEDIEYSNILLNKAINTHGINDWREFKNHRATICKQIKILKRNYIKQKF